MNPQQTLIRSQLDRARNFVLGRQEPEPEGRFISMFNCMSNEVSYGKFAICVILAIVCFMCCFFLLPTLVLSPASFVMCFTFSMIFIILALAFLNGPRLYMKKLFIQKNLYASLFLIVSILCALYFSVINPKYLWSLIFCIFELNAVLFYFFNTTAISWEQLKQGCSMFGSAVKSKF